MARIGSNQAPAEGLCSSEPPEIYRVKGELAGDEECFEQSLKIARQQQAKSWELRTATSMAQLYKQQNKREAARALLAPIYNSFTEGSTRLTCVKR